jgi:uncharacterized protein YjbI with pentapeptide repeats
MTKKYTSDIDYQNEDFSIEGLVMGEYENCTFRNCKFNGTSLAHFIFSECTFEECDLSNCQLTNTTFRDSAFDNCKMLGLRFEDCNSFLFSVNFKSCALNFSSFFQMKLKTTQFSACALEEVDFTECDLSQANFYAADLKNTVFFRTNLTGADFRMATNLLIDPENNKVQKAKFNRDNVLGLLTKYGLKID